MTAIAIFKSYCFSLVPVSSESTVDHVLLHGSHHLPGRTLFSSMIQCSFNKNNAMKIIASEYLLRLYNDPSTVVGVGGKTLPCPQRTYCLKGEMRLQRNNCKSHNIVVVVIGVVVVVLLLVLVPVPVARDQVIKVLECLHEYLKLYCLGQLYLHMFCQVSLSLKHENTPMTIHTHTCTQHKQPVLVVHRICSCKFTYQLKSICNIPSNTHSTFAVICGHMQSREKI